MKIRILESIASSEHGAHKKGDIVDWPDDKEAKQLIKSGSAEAAKTRKTKPKVETASKSEEVETATAE